MEARITMRVAVVVMMLSLLPCTGRAEAARKVSREQALEAATTKVQPAYPPVAKQLNIEGAVDLEATVSEDGAVSQVNIVSGNPVLTKPSIEALKKWKFKPFMEDGKAVQVIAPVHFTFRKM